METAIGLGGLIVALVASVLSFLTVRRAQGLSERTQRWEVARTVYERQGKVIEEALAACDDLVQHAHTITQYWRRDPLESYGVASGLGPGALWERYGEEMQKLETQLVYGLDIEDFFRARHRLLLWSQRILDDELKAGLVQFHQDSEEVLRYKVRAEGKEIQTSLYQQYLHLMEIAGRVVANYSSGTDWPVVA